MVGPAVPSIKFSANTTWRLFHFLAFSPPLLFNSSPACSHSLQPLSFIVFDRAHLYRTPDCSSSALSRRVRSSGPGEHCTGTLILSTSLSQPQFWKEFIKIWNPMAKASRLVNKRVELFGVPAVPWRWGNFLSHAWLILVDPGPRIYSKSNTIHQALPDFDEQLFGAKSCRGYASQTSGHLIVLNPCRGGGMVGSSGW